MSPTSTVAASITSFWSPRFSAAAAWSWNWNPKPMTSSGSSRCRSPQATKWLGHPAAPRSDGRSSAGALGEVHDYLVACFFADALTQRRLNRQLVGAVAQGHERGRERLAVHGAADLDQAAGAEERG